MMDTVKQVDALDGSVLAVVEVSGDEFVFVRMGFFLDGVVEDEDAGLVLVRTMGLTNCRRVLESGRCWAGKRVIR